MEAGDDDCQSCLRDLKGRVVNERLQDGRRNPQASRLRSEKHEQAAAALIAHILDVSFAIILNASLTPNNARRRFHFTFA